ncbi:tail fiber protein [Endozoicomonas lisbonensis]|uniref:Cyclic nucleotide-binding domain-containing protein n=1 Tax=Endozoicomonas lisbonensis TaxID=3120522 RepID=A0ABV2SPA3_9GAMM
MSRKGYSFDSLVREVEAHHGNEDNPHNLDKKQLDLGNVDNVQQAPIDRKINTTAPLQGGGDLTADRTLSVRAATTELTGVSKLNDAIDSKSTTESATPNAVRQAYEQGTEGIEKAEDALDKIDELNASIVGQFKHLGGVDLSSGKYPDKPEYSAIWHVQIGGTVGEETHIANASTKSSEVYEKGDSLVYSLDLDKFYKVQDKASISSDEVYDKFLQKTAKAADTGKVDGKDARHFNHGTNTRGMIAGSVNESPERGGFIDGTNGGANPTGNRAIGFQAVGDGGTRMFQILSPTVNTEVWFRSKDYQNGDWRGWGKFFSTLDKPKVADVDGLQGELNKKSDTGHEHSDLVKKSGDTISGHLRVENGALPWYEMPEKPEDSAADYPQGLSVGNITSGSNNGWPTSHTTVLTVKAGSSTTRMIQILGDSNSHRLYWRSAHNSSSDPGFWKPFRKIYHEGDKPSSEEIGASPEDHNHDNDYLGKTAQASDSAKLDGKAASSFATSGHNHDSVYSKTDHTHSGYASSNHNHDNDYLGKTAQASDSAKLDGKAASSFATSGHNHDSVYSKTDHTHSGYASSNHNHDNDYLGKTAQASDSAKLDGKAASSFATSGHNHDSVYSKTDHTHSGYASSNHNHDSVYVRTTFDYDKPASANRGDLHHTKFALKDTDEREKITFHRERTRMELYYNYVSYKNYLYRVTNNAPRIVERSGNYGLTWTEIGSFPAGTKALHNINETCSHANSPVFIHKHFLCYQQGRHLKYVDLESTPFRWRDYALGLGGIQNVVVMFTTNSNILVLAKKVRENMSQDRNYRLTISSSGNVSRSSETGRYVPDDVRQDDLFIHPTSYKNRQIAILGSSLLDQDSTSVISFTHFIYNSTGSSSGWRMIRPEQPSDGGGLVYRGHGALSMNDRYVMYSDRTRMLVWELSSMKLVRDIELSRNPNLGTWDGYGVARFLAERTIVKDLDDIEISYDLGQNWERVLDNEQARENSGRYLRHMNSEVLITDSRVYDGDDLQDWRVSYGVMRPKNSEYGTVTEVFDGENWCLPIDHRLLDSIQEGQYIVEEGTNFKVFNDGYKECWGTAIGDSIKAHLPVKFFSTDYEVELKPFGSDQFSYSIVSEKVLEMKCIERLEGDSGSPAVCEWRCSGF